MAGEDLFQFAASHPAQATAAIAVTAFVTIAGAWVIGRWLQHRDRYYFPPARFPTAYSIRRWLADRGDAQACFDVAEMLASGTKGAPLNRARSQAYYDLAHRRFGKLARRKQPYAHYMLGEIHRLGLSTTSDASRAKEHYYKARVLYDARLGEKDVHTFKALANMNQHGHGGDRNTDKALEYYKKAAELDDFESQHFVANALYNSGAGPKVADGAEYYLKAALNAAAHQNPAQRVAQADLQYMVGRLYEDGIGLGRNPQEAFKWYAVASKHGNAPARAAVARLDAGLDARTRRRYQEAFDDFCRTGF